MNRDSAKINMNVVAALAAKLAQDVNENRLWPGEFRNMANQIRAALDQAQRDLNE